MRDRSAELFPNNSPHISSRLQTHEPGEKMYEKNGESR